MYGGTEGDALHSFYDYTIEGGANDAVFFDVGMGTVTNCKRQNPPL